MKFEYVVYAAAALSAASAHTIMNKINNNAQGLGIYMPSDDSVNELMEQGEIEF
jgi:hypothetical protein